MGSKPDISNIINYLQNNLDKTDITLNKEADDSLIRKLQKICQIELPDDLKQFYLFSNGFESTEDIFRIIPIEEIIDNADTQPDRLYIAEYMIYSDVWELDINPMNANDYKIFNIDRFSKKAILTNSFSDFLQRFLHGGVFETGGLYDWHDEVKSK